MKTNTLILILICLLACFVCLQPAQAVVPAPDGGYPGGNTAEGASTLFSLTSGVNNTGIGHQALFRNTTGNSNTAEGFRALFNNTTGGQNTATGFNTLFHNTTGQANTGDGREALFSNTTGGGNTANGFQALFSNSSGDGNTANGTQALFQNTGGDNTAIGTIALYSNTVGGLNTASGASAMFSNTTGNFNTATGDEALYRNTTGNYNSGHGISALFSNTTGMQNTANGALALDSNEVGSNNTAIGFRALVLSRSNNNIGLGANAGSGVTSASNVIAIGVPGANVSNSCYIGNIFGELSAGGIAVRINSDGKLGTVTSSRRFKENIESMDKASETLFSLKPVTFRYKEDNTRTLEFGLVAEEVAEVDAALVVRDREGKPYTVRYEAVNAMLLNEFLKEHRKVEEQRRDFEAALAQQQKQIEALTAVVQKVSAQLEPNKPALQTVLNDH